VLGYIVGAGGTKLTEGIRKLYEQYPSMRLNYAQVSQWSGLPIPVLLGGELPSAVEEAHSAAAIREAAMAFGVFDVLTETGLRFADSAAELFLR